jgi:chromate transporter
VKDLALAFLKLGTIAFGGPAAHIAMMEDEFVRRRGWLTRAQFLDLVGAAGLIPGPSSTEVAIYIGHRRAGARGLLLAGICFILPAAVLVTAIAAAYVRYGRLPAVGGVLYGVKAVIIAIVAQVLVGFARTALRSTTLAALAVAAAVAAALGAPPVAVLAGTGLTHFALHHFRRDPRSEASVVVAGLARVVGPAAIATVGAPAPSSLFGLLLVFIKVGAVVFGSGYVLLAFLRDDLVSRLHWLTEPQLIDAVAVGQFTPGPVFTTATFVGFLVAGLPGAAVATVGIFLPSFVFVALSAPLVPRLRESRAFASILDGVNAASVALMAVVAVQLARSAIVDLPTGLLAVASGVILLVRPVNSAWLVLAGAVFGWIARR